MRTALFTALLALGTAGCSSDTKVPEGKYQAPPPQDSGADKEAAKTGRPAPPK